LHALSTRGQQRERANHDVARKPHARAAGARILPERRANGEPTSLLKKPSRAEAVAATRRRLEAAAGSSRAASAAARPVAYAEELSVRRSPTISWDVGASSSAGVCVSW